MILGILEQPVNVGRANPKHCDTQEQVADEYSQAYDYSGSAAVQVVPCFAYLPGRFSWYWLHHQFLGSEHGCLERRARSRTCSPLLEGVCAASYTSGANK